MCCIGCTHAIAGRSFNRFLECVQGAGSDIAVDDPESAKRGSTGLSLSFCLNQNCLLRNSLAAREEKCWPDRYLPADSRRRRAKQLCYGPRYLNERVVASR